MGGALQDLKKYVKNLTWCYFHVLGTGCASFLFCNNLQDIHRH